MPESSPPKGDPEVVAALAAVKDVTDFSDRLDRLSAHFVGRPYLAFTLVGDATTPEEPVARLDGFDCVTYAESVIALARSQSPSDFGRELRALRYDRGRVDWAARNHFMNRWIERNQRDGWVQPVLSSAQVSTGEVRHLDLLSGYEAQSWAVTYVPVSALERLAAAAEVGDVVAFVSRKPNLDTFHVGLLVPPQGELPLRVRHAGRKAGQVIEQPLHEFITINDVPGLLLARPVPPPPAEEAV
ncbi:MAG: N-acetylmuramoyl-L-alanine amidase-like domain-containing protein [Myxococcota bacterium]